MIENITCRKNKIEGSRVILVRAVFMTLIASLTVLAGTQKVLYAHRIILKASTEPAIPSDPDNRLWKGPILFHEGNGKPVHLILVEKATQKLFLYRYDGQYRLIKSYACSTGEKHGRKSEEKDEKTPEGIYFNVSVYRDSKITVFGDRAFGLNYPDVYDEMVGNRGGGIFIHGSNRNIKPFSTNGCVVLSNADLADLDKRTPLKKTPVLIGEHLPYQFKSVPNEISELIPLFKQVMVPKQYIPSKFEFQSITVLKYQDRVVAVGEVRINEASRLMGLSRLYLVKPAKNLLVLIKREWSEERAGY